MPAFKKLQLGGLLLFFFLSGLQPAQSQQLNKEKLKEIAWEQAERWKNGISRKNKDTKPAIVPPLMLTPYHEPGKLPLLYEPANLEAAQAIHTNQVWAGGIAGLSLSGSGQNIGFWDADRPRITHDEFAGRVTFADKTPSNANDNHATEMIGTLIATGVDPDARGAAFEGTAEAYDWSNDSGEMAGAATDGLELSNHPYANTAGWKYNFRGDGKWTWYAYPSIDPAKAYQFGYYNDGAQTWDRISYNAPNYLIVKAAGNLRGRGPLNQPVEHWVPEINDNGDVEWILSDEERPQNGGPDGFETVTSASVSKNVLVVGAVKSTTDNFDNAQSIEPLNNSGFGPTDDGRIKPDLVAPGAGLYTTGSGSDSDYSQSSGTSAASAVVTGAAALLQQHFKNLADSTISAASLRGLLAHTADDLGNPGPDYKFGWGLLNTERAARFLTAAIDDGTTLFEEINLSDGENLQRTFEHYSNQPLKITITWTDPEGIVPSNADDPTDQILVNDLDLRVTGPKSVSHAPWKLDRSQPSLNAATGDNTSDNIEQVYISQAQQGTYTITISPKSTLENGSQKVTLLAGPAEPEQSFETVSPGLWSQDATWKSGTAPSAPFHRAVINHEVTLDQQTRIGGITFDGSNGMLNLDSYSLTLSRSLFYNSGGVGFQGTDQSSLTFEDWNPYSDPLIFDPTASNLNELHLAVGSEDTLQLGAPLNIYGHFNLDRGTLSTEGNQLVLITDTAHAATLKVQDGKVKGNLSYSRLYAEKKSGWRLISAPFRKVKFSSLNSHFHTQGGSWATYQFPEPQESGDPVSNLWQLETDSQTYTGYYGPDTSFTPGKGYLFYMYEKQSDSTQILPESWIVEGDVNNDTTISLYRGSEEANSYNLLGNPFAGTLDWHDLHEASQAVGSTYVVWDPAATTSGGSSGFRYYNATDGIGGAGRYIAPMQGFFVTATGSNPAINFTHDQKVPEVSPEVFGKEPDHQTSPYVQLQLYNEENRLLENEIYMVFNPQASKEYDPSDVLRIQSLSGQPNTLSFIGPDDHMLAFEGRSMIDGDEQFKLKPQVSSGDTFTIKWPVWNHIPNEWKIELVDKNENRKIDMRRHNSYAFTYSDTNKKTKNPEISIAQGVISPFAHLKEEARFIINITTPHEDKGELPTRFSLEQNYPNPFNPKTTIQYSLPEASNVKIELFNLIGQQIAILINSTQKAGQHSFDFDASHLSSGVYFYRLTAGDYIETRSMTLVK